MPKKRATIPTATRAETYQHPEATAPLRPEVGAQSRFHKAQPPTTYRYDGSLSPALEWDGQNPAREAAEQLIAEMTACGLQIADLAKEPASKERDAKIRTLKDRIKDAQSRTRKISSAFLNWTGKAERLSFEVPTLPLFVHERLSTKAIIETIKGHRRDKQEDFFDLLYGAPQRSLVDQVLHAYEHGEWVNRLALGDSLVVMNSLLRYEHLGGQVQMIYVDPPYGVKFGSNFQPFIRRRDVKHNEDDDLTREPEMVQAYRDTWELGLHSYLTYLRDRLLLARDLLAPSGSIFVQISDENLHHVREVMDEVFGAENFLTLITFKKTTSLGGAEVTSAADYLVWYARDRDRVRTRKLFMPRGLEDDVGGRYTRAELPDGSRRPMTTDERSNPERLPLGARVYRHDNLTSARPAGEGDLREYEFEGKTFTPGRRTFMTDKKGLDRLAEARRLAYPTLNSLAYVRYAQDFAFAELANVWTDTQTGAFTDEKLYVVQTNAKVIQRCILMTTDPGDLVLDPTCGSGTTAFVAEQWGRRWITCDTSRVPLALARQRLLTATFDYYELKDPARGPSGGFVYKRRQNKKGEEVGGIVPHITLKSIANDQPPDEEVLVDRPEVQRGVVRVTGPFAFEATLPVAHGLDDEPETPGLQGSDHRDHVERMIDILRRSPALRLPGNQSVVLRNVRPPARTLALSAEALIDGQSPAEDAAPERGVEAVAILFGPENGTISNRLVEEAAREAHGKDYARLLVIGFGIEPKARETIEHCEAVFGVPAVYLAATMDLQMGDLLKNMRSSQIFSVCGLPEVGVSKLAGGKKGDEAQWQVALLGLDTFDPVTMEAQHLRGEDVPAWMLDTDYNGMCFHVSQAFFPRTGAWENLKKALRATFEETVWDHLAGTTSAPFPAGEHRQIAVKVIDPRGNDLLVVKRLEEKKK